jgi:hypothetical protein
MSIRRRKRVKMDLEAALERVPQKWREVTRTRYYAVTDYLNAGEDGPLLVDVLCRRLGVGRTLFYQLVRLYRESGNPALLAPWAKRPDTRPRVDPEVTSHIEAAADRLIADMVTQSIEPVAQAVLRDWPLHLKRPGISYVRKLVGRLKEEHEKKTTTPRLVQNDGESPAELAVEARWPLDVLVVDHSAIEVLVLCDEEFTVPVVTTVVDLFTRCPIGAALNVLEPNPIHVRGALADAAAFGTRLGNVPAPRIVVSTTFGSDWGELTHELLSTGATVVARRTPRLHHGGPTRRLIGSALAGYPVAPRLAHRPLEDRVSARAISNWPKRELATVAAEVRQWREDGRMTVEDAIGRHSTPQANSGDQAWFAMLELVRAEGAS